jgi:O-methyltransferase
MKQLMRWLAGSRGTSAETGEEKASPSLEELLPDISPADLETIRFALPFTMTSPERVYATIQAVRYVVNGGIPGDIVECGVWKGGSMMAVARMLRQLDSASRDLYLFDTYAGMPPPTKEDVSITGDSPMQDYGNSIRKDGASRWCLAELDEVQENMRLAGYPTEHVHYIKGRVEETIPDRAPSGISILRLDTDWYSSTRHELEHLYARLAKGGVLIIDDYGHWEGCRRAVDEYFERRKEAILFTRVDYTGRVAVKLVD